MTVKEALVYFAGTSEDCGQALCSGRGWVSRMSGLGQSATTLSGGEAQRVKLASHLATARSVSEPLYASSDAAAKARSRTPLYPGRADDRAPFRRCRQAAGRLPQADLEGGGSLLVIEHNLGCDQERGLGDRHGAGGWKSAGGQIVAVGNAGGDSRQSCKPHRALVSRPVLHGLIRRTLSHPAIRGVCMRYCSPCSFSGSPRPFPQGGRARHFSAYVQLHASSSCCSGLRQHDPHRRPNPQNAEIAAAQAALDARDFAKAVKLLTPAGGG